MPAHDSIRNAIPCVYFIRFGESGPIKIGKTNRGPLYRLSLLQTASPVELFLMGIISDPDPEFTEEALHQRFFHLWIRGEWFMSTLELTNFIADHATPHVSPHRDSRPVDRSFYYDIQDDLWDDITNQDPRSQAEMDQVMKRAKVIRAEGGQTWANRSKWKTRKAKRARKKKKKAG